MKGDVWHLIADATVNTSAKARYREHKFSGDSAHLAYIDNADEKGNRRLVVSDTTFKRKLIIDTGVTVMTLNDDRTAIAAVSRDSAGRERVIQFNIAKPDAVTRGADYDKVSRLLFAPAGTDLAYFGERQGRMYGVFNGQEEVLPEGVTPKTPVINQAGKSVGVLMSANNTVSLYQMFRDSGRKGNVYDEAEWLVYSSDGAVSAFAARKGKSWSVVVNGKEGPKFDRVVTPRFSPDGKFLVYRARKEGKRFVVVADASGAVLRKHRSYEQVFDVQFTSDGKSVAYGVKDGKKLLWKVERL
jgi:WD40 repeat protein